MAAIENNAEVVILGAFGCGAFKHAFPGLNVFSMVDENTKMLTGSMQVDMMKNSFIKRQYKSLIDCNLLSIRLL